jgi:putative acyl-CoA dehydrogenase
VLRSLAHDREATAALLGQLARDTADLPGARETAAFIERALSESEAEATARAPVGCLAMLAAAAALRDSAPADVAEMFARTRLATPHGALFGTVNLAANELQGVLERALPPG